MLPMMVIMSVEASGPCVLHQPFHLLDAFGKAHEQRLADEEMADVQFDNLGNRCNRLDVVKGEAVAGVDFEAERGSARRAVADELQFVHDARIRR